MERFTARAQFTLTLLTLILFFGLVYLLVLWPATIEEGVREFLESIIVAMIAIATQQSAYWFARQRPNAPAPAALPAPLDDGKDVLDLMDELDKEIAAIEHTPLGERTPEGAARLIEARKEREKLLEALLGRLSRT